MTSSAAAQPAFLLADAEVVAVDRLSPTFVRVTFGGADLTDFHRGPVYDLRIKLIFPIDGRRLPRFDVTDPAWYQSWRALPAAERGEMRTYTVRAVRTDGDQVLVDIDFALHVADDLGPGTRWAAAAAPGDHLLLLGPRQGSTPGGIEFAGDQASSILLVGDETAVPAVAGILRDLPAEARGDVVLEVPGSDDVLELAAPDRVTVHWRPRNGGERGAGLLPVVEELAARALSRPAPAGAADPDLAADSGLAADGAVEDNLWETPRYSSATQTLVADAEVDQDFYAWIAGESRVVTGLRRYLVKDLGIARSQVAFMGYWREGVALG